MYNIVSLKARYDLNSVESTVKPQPTNSELIQPNIGLMYGDWWAC